MPVKSLPAGAHLDHLKQQAKDLSRARSSKAADAAQRIREFHPGFFHASDAEIFAADWKLSDAQLTIARERGFTSWPRMKRRVESPIPSDDLRKPHHERIEDATFRHAVALLDAGDAEGLRAWLRKHPALVRQRVSFEGGNYFRNPALLEFAAENPIRRGTLPRNIVEVAQAILNAGAKLDPVAMNATLELVASGRVPRECGVQLALIDLLCDYGADPDRAAGAATAHGEFQAVHALIRRGASITLPVAAALGDTGHFARLLPAATPEQRHLALAFAAQFGRLDIVRMLLDAGEDPNRYNPPGAHAHSTPLHQAACYGHLDIVQLMVERGARLDFNDTMWQGTPADWAEHEGKQDIAAYLRARESICPEER